MILKKLLGEILGDLGYVTNEQIREALRIQQKTYGEKKDLPERLKRASLISEARLAKEKDPAPMVGQILTDMGYIKEEQLETALKQQFKTVEVYKLLDSEKLGTVIEIGSIINSSLNLAEVLSLIMKHVNRVTNSVASTMMLIDEKTQELVFSVPTGPEAEKLTDIHIPSGKGIAGWVAENGKPVLIPNVKEDSRFYSGIDELCGFETKTIICVPLKAKTKLIGVIEAVNKSDGTTFTEEDALFLSIFASQAAIAIENARLYSELYDQFEETRQMQIMLTKSEKFEALGQMAAGVAHDFNNILTAIMGYSEMANQDIPPKHHAHESINEVLKASNRAQDLVKQILAISRQSEQEKKPIYLHLIVKEALKLLRASIPTTIEIRQNIATNDDSVLADPTQIHQIMMNLCTNAYHAMMEKGGTLEVAVKAVELDENKVANLPDLKPGPHIKFSLSDTGQGMDQSTMDRIFDPYFTTKEKGVGTGMGLAVVHGIVKSHDGAITVSSKPGKGTTFHIFFPKIRKMDEYETESKETLYFGYERILFVDDEKPIVELGKKMLERFGYKVLARTSSIEALEAFRADPNKFDTVITDMTMPHMTGDVLAEEIMAIRPDIPIILCTGFSESITKEKIKSTGIRELVKKPIVMSNLAMTIRSVLDEKG